MSSPEPAWLMHPGAPALLQRETLAPDSMRLALAVAPDTPWVQGHFPERAVLPGVVLLRWAIEATGWLWPGLGAVQGVSNLKFQHPVLPPAELVLQLELQRKEGGHRLQFTYSQEEQSCARGGVAFA